MNHFRKQATYYIEAYGCQMNFYDSGLIATILEQSGYRPAEDVQNADVVLVNTCSVRDHAERRALGRIRELAGLKNNRPDARLVVCGCMAQRMGQEMLRRIGGVDLVVGTDQYESLPELLERSRGVRSVATRPCTEQMYSRFVPRSRGGVCAFVAVMRGCDNRCAYCIVPQLRGTARSRPMNDVLREASELAEEGVRDITFLGQNVNIYRDGRYRFSDLLRKASQIDGLWRIRFVTSHPRDMDEEIFRAMAESPKVCEHLHLPMQSGSDRILRAMRRGYTSEAYRSLVDGARERVTGLSVTTDLIAGFPGETDEDFRQTVEMMRAIEFDNAFTFQYSPRPGTEAATMPQQVPSEVRLDRLNQLITLQREITHRVCQRLVGHVFEILVEKQSKRNEGELLGRTKAHKAVVFPGGQELVGKLAHVRIDSARAGTARGRVLSRPQERRAPGELADTSLRSS